MDYLIYNKSDELIDVITFNSTEDLDSYKRINPSHRIELTKDIEENFLIEDEFEDDKLLEEDN